MKKIRLMAISGIVASAVLILTLAGSSPVFAHEDRPVGPYNFHVGWHVEPALDNQPNAVELTVTENNKPVSDVDKTLKVTVSTGGQTSDSLSFDASDETPGLYTATIIPTVAGDYKFHFVGTVGTTKVDETFDSAQGKFNSVDPLDEYEFPVKAPSNSDLQKEIDDLKAQIAAMKGGTSGASMSTAAPTMAATASK